MKVAEPTKQFLKGERQRLAALQTAGEGPQVLQLVVRGVDTRRVRVGGLVWRTKQAGLLAGIRQGYEGASAVDKRRVAVDAVLSGLIGEPLMLTLSVRHPLVRNIT